MYTILKQSMNGRFPRIIRYRVIKMMNNLFIFLICDHGHVLDRLIDISNNGFKNADIMLQNPLCSVLAE
ncbi:hypothetical protein D3C81_1713650 [compost metagenome]